MSGNSVIPSPMPSSRPADPKTAAHHHLWNDDLQDWLDDAPQATEARPFAAHLSDCDLCPAQLDRFRELESALRAHTPPLSLDETFDTQLLSRIQAADVEQQLAARQRMAQELLSGLAALSRSRRRALAFIAPGMAAGGAVAFALATHFSTTALSQAPLPGNPALLPSIVTALLGASIGGLVAGWLAKSAS